MKTISLSLYNRPIYTKIVLDHLNNCFEIDNYKIFIHCEPINNEVIELAKAFRPEQTELIINPNKLGCSKNIYQCWENGFKHGDFHIHLEDDTVPSKDFLVYCEWARSYFKDRPEIFSISGYVNSNNTHISQSINLNNNYNLVSTRNWFTPWGWATWIDRWPIIREAFDESLTSTMSWDCLVHKKLNNKFETYPLVSRVQNIGAEKGTYCPSAEWHYNNQYNAYWIETSQQYQLHFVENKISYE